MERRVYDGCCAPYGTAVRSYTHRKNKLSALSYQLLEGPAVAVSQELTAKSEEPKIKRDDASAVCSRYAGSA